MRVALARGSSAPRVLTGSATGTGSSGRSSTRPATPATRVANQALTLPPWAAATRSTSGADSSRTTSGVVQAGSSGASGASAPAGPATGGAVRRPGAPRRRWASHAPTSATWPAASQASRASARRPRGRGGATSGAAPAPARATASTMAPPSATAWETTSESIAPPSVRSTCASSQPRPVAGSSRTAARRRSQDSTPASAITPSWATYGRCSARDHRPRAAGTRAASARRARAPALSRAARASTPARGSGPAKRQVSWLAIGLPTPR